MKDEDNDYGRMERPEMGLELYCIGYKYITIMKSLQLKAMILQTHVGVFVLCAWYYIIGNIVDETPENQNAELL